MEIAALKKESRGGEGLELLQGTKGSQSEGKGNRGANKSKPLEEAWN